MNAIVDYTGHISVIFTRLFVDMTVTHVLLIFIFYGFRPHNPFDIFNPG